MAKEIMTNTSVPSIIDNEVYNIYRENLLSGNRVECTRIVNDLIVKEVGILDLYINLFQRSLYEVGSMWEMNQISVAVEHLATSITSNLLNLIYPILFNQEKTGQKVIVSCVANEYHQIGGRMVADIFELHGWNSYFLGANMPNDHLLDYVQENKPDLIAISMAIFSNLPILEKMLAALQNQFPKINIVIGGQAFRWGGSEICQLYPNVKYLESLNSLRNFLEKVA